jgi:hypothetical protein
VVHRADGGNHDASNIVLCCFSCHQAHHAGRLTISGTADQLMIRRPDEHVSNGCKAPITPPSVAPPSSAWPSIMKASDGVHAASPVTSGVRVNAGGAVIVSDVSGQRRTPTHSVTEICADTSSVQVANQRVTSGTASRLDAAILQTQAKAALTGSAGSPPSRMRR